jgi:hypothetical protein
MDLQSRRALLKQFAPQYRSASLAHKRVLLDAFVQATGYHRGSGLWLLNHAEDVLHAPVSARASRDAARGPTRAWRSSGKLK